MFEIVPSRYMRNYYKEVNFSFTDFQKSTLIWNAPGKGRKEIMDALQELAGTTTDECTQMQIKERLHYEEIALSTFKDNSAKKYVYVVEDQDYENAGFFAYYDMAEQYAVRYMQEYDMKCCIKKQQIVFDEKDEIVHNPCRGNNYMGIKVEEYCSYGGDEVAAVYLSKTGEIEYFYSYELPEEEKRVDSYNPNRFENQFIKVPFPLSKGTSIRNVITGKYAILAQGEKEWNKYLNSIEEKKLYVDFSDVQVIVLTLTESGSWSHEHVNPLFLEVANNKSSGNEKQQAFFDAMKAMEEYLYYKENGINRGVQQVIQYSKQYAKICHDDGWEKQFECAQNPEDIIR